MEALEFSVMLSCDVDAKVLHPDSISRENVKLSSGSMIGISSRESERVEFSWIILPPKPGSCSYTTDSPCSRYPFQFASTICSSQTILKTLDTTIRFQMVVDTAPLSSTTVTDPVLFPA